MSLLTNGYSQFPDVKQIEEYMITKLRTIKSDRFIKLTVITDIINLKSGVKRVGSVELRFVNVLISDSVIPGWLSTSSKGKGVCFGDSHLLLFAKPFVKQPFLVIKDIRLLNSDFLHLFMPKLQELEGINRTYYFLQDQSFQDNMLEIGSKPSKRGNATGRERLVFNADIHTLDSHLIYDNSYCQKCQCNGCVNSKMWLLTPDFFELSELQFESFLIEQNIKSSVRFSIESVLDDLTLKEIVSLNPVLMTKKKK